MAKSEIILGGEIKIQLNPTELRSSVVSPSSVYSFTIDTTKKYFIAASLNYSDSNMRSGLTIIDKGVKVYEKSTGNYDSTLSGTTLTLTNYNVSFYMSYTIAVSD